MKTRYLSESEALQQENEQLAMWYRDLQERYLKQELELKRLSMFIQRQSGANYIGGGMFRRHNGQGFALSTAGEYVLGNIDD